MTVKTTAERQRTFKESRRLEGLNELRGVYAHPDDKAAIRAFANKVLQARQKAAVTVK